MEIAEKVRLAQLMSLYKVDEVTTGQQTDTCGRHLDSLDADTSPVKYCATRNMRKCD